MVKQSRYDELGCLRKQSLIRKIKEAISREHGLVVGDLIINWLLPWTLTRFPSGLIQMVGKIRLRAPKFKSKDFWVYQIPKRKWSMN